MAKRRGEMSADELAVKEAEEFAVGPLSVLTSAVKGNSQVRFFSQLYVFLQIFLDLL